MSFYSALAACCVAAVLTSTSTAHATTVWKQDRWDGDEYLSSTFNGGGYTRVTLESDVADVTANAGGFALTDRDGPLGDFIAWCLEITRSLSISASGGRYYKYTPTPSDAAFGPVVSTEAAANIQKLFNTGYKGLDLSSDSESAGFQLAIWELLYETDGAFSLTEGSFKQTTTDGTAGLANIFAEGLLANLHGASTGKYDLTFLGSRYSQNLVTATPIPLPAAISMLAVGLAGLGLARRRKPA